MNLLLSIFPGVDLFGRGFEAEGFMVVRGPDLIFGGDIRRFHPPRGVFEGIFGGSPCQDFSSLRRNEPSGLGVEMLAEFARCVTEGQPAWFLLENVPRVPDIVVPGYKAQRFNLRASEFGGRQHRLRTFQFGYRYGQPLVIPRSPLQPGTSQEPAALASEGRRADRRGWPEFCELQGLPRDYDLPGFTKSAKYQAVGNGVPLQLARAVAAAIAGRPVTLQLVCICECGRPVRAGRTLATAACRKRMQRKRDAAGVTPTSSVTSGVSLELPLT